jgi:hypothetical protein
MPMIDVHATAGSAVINMVGCDCMVTRVSCLFERSLTNRKVGVLVGGFVVE